jgi:hypothetical protein
MASAWLARLFLAGALLQFFLAGVGVFGAGSFDAHKAVGDLLWLLSLLILFASLATRRGAPLAAALFGLMCLQWFLAAKGPEISSWLAAFHPLNGLAAMAVAGMLARGGHVEVGERLRAAPAS